MANILYGVNGEGAGHSTRSREVLSHLKERGHNLHVVSFDRGLKNLSEEFEVTEIHGFRFAYVNNQVRYQRTLARNLIAGPRALASLRRLLRLMDQWRIDLVVTDFEPLSCAAGRHKRLPVISIDNQHCLTNARITYPRRYAADAAAAKLVTRLMTPGADAYLVISFFEAPLRDRKRTFLFPPILRQEVLRARPTTGEHVLVYVTSPSRDLVRVLRQAPAGFVCYGFERDGRDGNLVFKKPSLDTFLADLVSCRAIIANSGFSLVSEALHLGKPYLAVPVKRQFEQVFNAYYLEKTGYGAFGERLDEERVGEFLSRLDQYRARLAAYPRQDNSALLAKLDALIAASVPRLHGATAL
ncbi:MAG TPA: MJ1255/VC2487 family glycosyltransferase [Terriglobales bacterium]|nr:MJ1255/VC2487 family glycosyltransferase [Terriglobales bacterium]